MYQGFADKADICREFSISDFDGYVLYASYEQGGYEGNAAVLYVNDGKLWAAYGSHCSCHGLEGQWEPEQVSVEELRRYAENGWGTQKELGEFGLRVVEDFDSCTGDNLIMAMKLRFG